jgi:hypothetical protein
MKTGGSVDVDEPKSIKTEGSEEVVLTPRNPDGQKERDSLAHDALTSLANVLSAEARDGLNPQGHPDCQWGEEYPAQYMDALDYLSEDYPAELRNEKGAFEHLCDLLYKIESEAALGRPLVGIHGEWSEGSYPPEYHAARAYVNEQFAKQDQEPDHAKTVYPDNWIRLYPDETAPAWLAALKEALTKPCEVCKEPLGNEPYIWIHRTSKAVRCPNCQETHWWSDGYEIDDFGNPSCWNHEHTREERIAEREQHLQQLRQRDPMEARLCTPAGWALRRELWKAECLPKQPL